MDIEKLKYEAQNKALHIADVVCHFNEAKNNNGRKTF